MHRRLWQGNDMSPKLMMMHTAAMLPLPHSTNLPPQEDVPGRWPRVIPLTDEVTNPTSPHSRGADSFAIKDAGLERVVDLDGIGVGSGVGIGSVAIVLARDAQGFFLAGL